MERTSESAMTVKDVAAMLNVDDKTIYRLAKRGEIPGFKVAGAWRFQRVDLERWIEERKRAQLASEHLETKKRTPS